jgi:hypothetical protein
MKSDPYGDVLRALCPAGATAAPAIDPLSYPNGEAHCRLLALWMISKRKRLGWGSLAEIHDRMAEKVGEDEAMSDEALRHLAAAASKSKSKKRTTAPSAREMAVLAAAFGVSLAEVLSSAGFGLIPPPIPEDLREDND